MSDFPPSPQPPIPLHKSRLRFIRYIALLIDREVLRGGAAKRRRFMGRVTRRVAQQAGLYTASAKLFATVYAIKIVALPAAERRQAWAQRRWAFAIHSLSNRGLLQNWVNATSRERPCVVVLGMGSIGDILQITPVLRELRAKLPTAQIVLLHRSPAAADVLRGNPNVDSIAVADFDQFERIKQAVALDGAADLAVEIRSVSYIVSYTRAPTGQRHPVFDAALDDMFFATAAAAQARWTRHPPVFPRRDERFSWPEEWKPYQYLDVLGLTANLPITRDAALDFQVGPADRAILDRLALPPAFVTIQNGVDTDVMNWAQATGQRPTKLLPLATMNGVVQGLRAQGLAVVQLGTQNDETVSGVTLDLRGKTSLREAAAVIAAARCHVGIEGGLVHLARAMGQRSVVAFGPTSVDFLGYPQNVNIIASPCNSCWWTTRDWYIYCPRGLAQPECMYRHQAAAILAAVSGA